MASLRETLQIPSGNKPLEDSGFFSDTWTWFFRRIQDILLPLGVERNFTLVNNQVAAAEITGLAFDKTGVTAAIVEYLVQRVTTGGGAVELIEAGSFSCAYRPTSEDWVLTVLHENAPANANILFSITAAGQVKYTTSNEGGTASISKIVWRARTLTGKNAQYSTFNR